MSIICIQIFPRYQFWIHYETSWYINIYYSRSARKRKIMKKKINCFCKYSTIFLTYHYSVKFHNSYSIWLNEYNLNIIISRFKKLNSFWVKINSKNFKKFLNFFCTFFSRLVFRHSIFYIFDPSHKSDTYCFVFVSVCFWLGVQMV